MKPVAVVTGGSRGLGAAICQRLARDGYHVHLTYRNRADKATEVIAAIEDAGGSADGSALDLTDLTAVDGFARQFEKSAHPPSVLVNCAGELLRLPLEDTDVDAFVGSLTVNCVAPFLLSRRLGEAMGHNGEGSIVNVSSVLGETGGQNRVAYTTSKAALIGLTRALAVELAPAVRVNSLLPGLFITDLNATLLEDEEKLRKTNRHVPLQRLGSPEEFADVAAFLAGPGSSYVTGASWAVDGGVLTRISLPLGDSS